MYEDLTTADNHAAVRRLPRDLFRFTTTTERADLQLLAVMAECSL